MRQKIVLLLTTAVILFGVTEITRSIAIFASPATSSLTELIVNGDMESNVGWDFPVTTVQGGYSTEHFVSPVRSARLGIVSGENKYAYSSMNQSISVPDLPAGGSLALSWRTYLLSQPLDASDLQYVQIRDNTGLHTIWSGRRNEAPDWLTCSYDVSAYAGQNITLYFGVKNDGVGGVTGMYIDDVSLTLSPSAQSVIDGCAPLESTPSPTTTLSPSPTAPATATPTPTPSGPPCQQLIENPSFDDGYDHWTQNLYLTASYRDEMGEEHTGAWFGGAEYVDQYLYQDVTIPAGSPVARLSFLWAFDPAEEMETGDAMTLTLRTQDDAVLATLLALNQNSTPRRWQNAEFDLGTYIGQTVRLQAQATTNASTPSWYLDQIQLYNCVPQERLMYLPWIVKK